jgi:hypothetical protein
VEADAALLLRAAIAAPFNRHLSIIHLVVNKRCDKLLVDQESNFLITKIGEIKTISVTI